MLGLRNLILWISKSALSVSYSQFCWENFHSKKPIQEPWIPCPYHSLATAWLAEMIADMVDASEPSDGSQSAEQATVQARALIRAQVPQDIFSLPAFESEDAQLLVQARSLFVSYDSESEFSNRRLIDHRHVENLPNQHPRVEDWWVFQRSMKILVAGYQHSGKSCFVSRLAENIYRGEDTVNNNVDLDFMPLELNVVDPIVSRPEPRSSLSPAALLSLSLQLWDIGSAVRFRVTNNTTAYGSSNGILLCFGIDDRNGLVALERTYLDAIRYAPPSCAMLVVGLKSDIDSFDDDTKKVRGQIRHVLTSAGADFARQRNLPYIECSARSGVRCKDALATLIHHILRKEEQIRREEQLQAAQVAASENYCGRSKCCIM